MKKQQKHQHHFPSRKSPRLSSSTSDKAESGPEGRPENAWALSLHVVEQQPLQIRYPSPEEDKLIRRSSRFTTNKYKTPPSERLSKSKNIRSKELSAASLLVVSQLRRSPRFSSSSSAPALTLTDGGNVGSGSKKRRRFSEEKEGGGRGGKMAEVGGDDGSFGRSMRLSGGENGSSRTQLLALPEPGSKSVSEGFLSEKRLRSRTVLMHVGYEKAKSEKMCNKKKCADLSVKEKFLRSRMVKYAMVESPEVSEKRAVRSDSSEQNSVQGCSFTEKTLRSRTVKMQVGNDREKAAKNVSKKSGGDYALIELPQDSETRNLRCSLMRSAMLNREEGESPEFEMLALPEKSGFPSEKCLRSRTVKMQVGSEREKTAKKEMKKSGGDYALIELPQDSDVGKLRSSCRRSAMLNWEDGESTEFEMLELPDKCAFVSENCLRSRTVKMQLQEERMERSASVKSASGVMSKKTCLMTPKKEPSLDKSRDVSEERDKEKCDLEGLSEKCLRSRRTTFEVDVDDNAERKPDSIGSKHNAESSVKSQKKEKSIVCCFTGEPIPEEVAQERWKWRYDLKSKKKGKGWKINADEEDEIILNVDCHYAQAKVGSFFLDIGDCVFVKGEGKKKHIGRILEFFKTTEGEDYFRVQWFFRGEDTVLKDVASLHDKRRIFYSTLMNDNILDCIISKVNVVQAPAALCLKSNPVQSAAFYYDMEYCVEYSTFRTLVIGIIPSSNDMSETSKDNQSFLLDSKHPDDEPITLTSLEVLPNHDTSTQELALLDLYSGCGGMSTGLCLGAKLCGVDLVTKWAVDYDSSACESLRLNHPETKVRNESAEDFLDLLRQWENLCKLYVFDIERTLKCELEDPREAKGCKTLLDTESSSGEYEVSSLVDVCYGDPSERGNRGLHFKVRWKGYGPDDDTWEPIEGLSNCQKRIQDFVRKGFNSKILPLPGDVDVICGGPPCQGISGYNRYRNFESPLDDERNRQIVVFMDIAGFLKPRYVLMENVVDIIRFDKGSLGRYALSRLVLMKYQARLGTIASGCYGLPQFRLRVFIWGAHPSETLPQFPLPTHDVVVKYWPPLEFERNIVAYDEGQPRTLEDAIVLGDSISDLPAVQNDEIREEMAYEKPPETEFQKYIRLSKGEMMGLASTTDLQTKSTVLYDHRPLKLSELDYYRVCLIPRRKGANFRDLPGVIVGEDNVARRDPTKEPVMLPTGRPLVPDCVFSFAQGKSRKPYARLWWDETVSTVVTFPHVRAQAILHPEQDRLLTIREYARLQGFPDFYRFCGTTKERYCQIGNAVSIPVARALGYALGMADRKVIGDEPLMRLPAKFSFRLPSADEVVVLGG